MEPIFLKQPLWRQLKVCLERLELLTDPAAPEHGGYPLPPMLPGAITHLSLRSLGSRRRSAFIHGTSGENKH